MERSAVSVRSDMCSFALVCAILATPIILASPAASRSIDVGSGFSGLEPITPGKNMLERSGVIWTYVSIRSCWF